MKQVLVIISALALCGVAFAQTTAPDWWVPLFDRNAMQLPQMMRIGDGLVVDWPSRMLLAPGTNPSHPVEVPVRNYGVRLSRASVDDTHWLIPIGALPDSLVIAVDRWPVYRGIDYDIIGQEIVPRYPWSIFTNRDPANQMVMADFDR